MMKNVLRRCDVATLRSTVALTLLLLVIVGCGPSSTGGPVTLKLVTHDSFEISETAITAFEEETGHTLEIVKQGDAGEMLNKSILSKNNPLGDVIFGIDNTFLSRALDEDILLAYRSPMLSKIDDALKIDPRSRALPVDIGDVCVNYDIGWFEENGIAPPTSLDDLVDPAYAGLTVVENPATSSPGLAFLLATIATYGEEGYLNFWQQLADNDVLVESGWSEAYFGAFTRAEGGTRPIVVSYASSPPVEVLFADPPVDHALTASIVAPNSCFRQIEFVGILNGTEHEAAARELIDFMLSEPFQNDMPLNMFVFPANENAELPQLFVDYAQIPEQPAMLDSAEIAANREAWIEAWTETVLR